MKHSRQIQSNFAGPNPHLDASEDEHLQPSASSHCRNNGRLDAGALSVDALFEASVKGVQTCFPHLDPLDIAHPPYQWADADFARQIALHMMVDRFDVSKATIIRDLQQSRERLKRSMLAIDERLSNEGFAKAYSRMEARAKAKLMEE